MSRLEVQPLAHSYWKPITEREGVHTAKNITWS
jgi:hypothetical protein